MLLRLCPTKFKFKCAHCTHTHNRFEPQPPRQQRRRWRRSQELHDGGDDEHQHTETHTLSTLVKRNSLALSPATQPIHLVWLRLRLCVSPRATGFFGVLHLSLLCFSLHKHHCFGLCCYCASFFRCNYSCVSYRNAKWLYFRVRNMQYSSLCMKIISIFLFFFLLSFM